MRQDSKVVESLAESLRERKWKGSLDELFTLVREITDNHPDGEAVIRWLEVCEQEDYEVPRDYRRFEIMADHSGLLARLLAGKDPLPKPPPIAMSRPWYSIIEDGVAEDIWKNFIWAIADTWPEESLTEKNRNQVVVFQDGWDIVEDLGDDGWLVTCENWTERVYRIEPTTYPKTRMEPMRDTDGNLVRDDEGQVKLTGPVEYQAEGWRMEWVNRAE